MLWRAWTLYNCIRESLQGEISSFDSLLRRHFLAYPPILSHQWYPIANTINYIPALMMLVDKLRAAKFVSDKKSMLWQVITMFCEISRHDRWQRWTHPVAFGSRRPRDPSLSRHPLQAWRAAIANGTRGSGAALCWNMKKSAGCLDFSLSDLLLV